MGFLTTSTDEQLGCAPTAKAPELIGRAGRGTPPEDFAVTWKRADCGWAEFDGNRGEREEQGGEPEDELAASC